MSLAETDRLRDEIKQASYFETQTRSQLDESLLKSSLLETELQDKKTTLNQEISDFNKENKRLSLHINDLEIRAEELSRDNNKLSKYIQSKDSDNRRISLDLASARSLLEEKNKQIHELNTASKKEVDSINLELSNTNKNYATLFLNCKLLAETLFPSKSNRSIESLITKVLLYI